MEVNNSKLSIVGFTDPDGDFVGLTHPQQG